MSLCVERGHLSVSASACGRTFSLSGGVRPRVTSALQATEDFMVHLFEDTNLCAIHAKRVTISALQASPVSVPADACASYKRGMPAHQAAATCSAQGLAISAADPGPAGWRVVLLTRRREAYEPIHQL